MKNIRVLYFIEAEILFNRMFTEMSYVFGFDQAACVPSLECAQKIRFGGAYVGINDIGSVLRHFKPDAVVFPDGSKFASGIKSGGFRLVFAGHGEWAKTPKNIEEVNGGYWKQYDLLCSGMRQFKDLFVGIPEYKNKILTNALLQYDSLYKIMGRQHLYRNDFLSKHKIKNPTKILTIFGPKITESDIHTPHNEFFYRSCIKLAELAERNNWLLIIKPKRNRMFDFLQTRAKKKVKWAQEVINDFRALKNNSRVVFVDLKTTPYTLFFADLLITFSRSNLEIEAALTNKPIVKIHADTDLNVSNYNVYGTGDFDAAYDVNDLTKLEETVVGALVSDNSMLFQNQRRFVQHLGLLFDGKAHERMLNAIRTKV